MSILVTSGIRALLFSLCLCLILLAGMATVSYAQSPKTPNVTGVQPDLFITPSSASSMFNIQGSGFRPQASALGPNLTDYYINTHFSQFFYITLQVETIYGKLGTVHKCTPDTWMSQGCIVSAMGDSGVTLQINPFSFSEWSDGSELDVADHVMFNTGHGILDLGSNAYGVPFSRQLAGPPVIDAFTPDNFDKAASSWQLQVQGHAIDKTAYVDFGISGAKPASLPNVNTVGSATFTVTIPPDVRDSGTHDFKLCRSLMDTSGLNARYYSNCSAAKSYLVTRFSERVGSERITSAAEINRRARELAPVPIATNITDLVTVTCPTTPMYASPKLDPITSEGQPLEAQQGQSFYAFRSSVQGIGGKQLRRIQLGASAYIDAACLK